MSRSKGQSGSRDLRKILSGWFVLLFTCAGAGVLLFSDNVLVAVGLFAVSVSAFAFSGLDVPRLKEPPSGDKPIDPIELKKWRESHPEASIEQAIEACNPSNQ